jgi:predicted DCC family thiol-disulfide oxidoreductase YuxK
VAGTIGPSASRAGTATAAERRRLHIAPELTVLYDADCGVCRLTIQALQRLDARGTLDPVPLQSFTAEHPTRDELLGTLHVRDRAGRWSRGGEAALRIAAVIPVLVPLAVVGRLPGAGRVADAAYGLVAHNRGTLGRLLRLDRCAPGLAVARGRAVDAPRLVKRTTGSQ